MGYRPDFLMLRATYRGLVETPPVLSGLVLLSGFLWARMTRRPQVPDSEARAVLRKEQRTPYAGSAQGWSRAIPRSAAQRRWPAFWMDGSRFRGSAGSDFPVGGNRF